MGVSVALVVVAEVHLEVGLVERLWPFVMSFRARPEDTVAEMGEFPDEFFNAPAPVLPDVVGEFVGVLLDVFPELFPAADEGGVDEHVSVFVRAADEIAVAGFQPFRFVIVVVLGEFVNEVGEVGEEVDEWVVVLPDAVVGEDVGAHLLVAVAGAADELDCVTAYRFDVHVVATCLAQFWSCGNSCVRL